MSEVVLSIGSNLNEGHMMVEKAIHFLESRLSDLQASEIYKTDSVNLSGAIYFNCVVEGLFKGTPEELQTECKKFETLSGRNEEYSKRGIVPIDIDIVIADGKILREWDYHQKFFQKGYRRLESVKRN